MKATPATPDVFVSTHNSKSRERPFIAGHRGGNDTRCTQFNCGWEQQP